MLANKSSSPASLRLLLSAFSSSLISAALIAFSASMRACSSSRMTSAALNSCAFQYWACLRARSARGSAWWPSSFGTVKSGYVHSSASSLVEAERKTKPSCMSQISMSAAPSDIGDTSMHLSGSESMPRISRNASKSIPSSGMGFDSSRTNPITLAACLSSAPSMDPPPSVSKLSNTSLALLIGSLSLNDHPPTLIWDMRGLPPTVLMSRTMSAPLKRQSFRYPSWLHRLTLCGSRGVLPGVFDGVSPLMPIL
mmetsp:Transcript_43379/g.84722  ORF Transcript_43379/g.84722 Transcript_43379/m.84722 type:complete len:253 (+) Transcript_43379:107-865(+)